MPTAAWVILAHRYQVAGILPEQLDKWLNLRKQYQTATMDFVSLQQLDYDRGISCTCGNGAQHLMADGLSLGHALRRLCIVAPWQPSSPQADVCGSLFSARVGISNKQLRQGVLDFANHKLKAEQHRRLVDSLRRLPASRDLERAVLPFVQDAERRVSTNIVVPKEHAR